MPKCGIKLRDFDSYRSCCIRHNFFGCGTNEQYMKVYRLMATGGMPFDDVVLATWLCSDAPVEYIREVLKKELVR